MKSDLEAEGYVVGEKRLSPHRFGIPQTRERIFIVGSRKGLDRFAWPEQADHPDLSIVSALDREPEDARRLAPQLIRCLDVWQEFLDRFPKDVDLPYFPIWSMEFGATYPFEHTTPFASGKRRLCRYRGSHGTLLREAKPDERMLLLPSHARTPTPEFPGWKKNFIRWNRELYRANQSWIDTWRPKILQFPPSLQKLEWNCKGEERNIWDYVIQIRASGVRVKRRTTAPSLIAMTSTQVPIIAWEKRYVTPRECSRLQSIDDLEHLPSSSDKAFEAFGNAVNASLVERVAERLCGRSIPPVSVIR
jgi:DNA (cytosine-5)-methyltransferase 1